MYADGREVGGVDAEEGADGPGCADVAGLGEVLVGSSMRGGGFEYDWRTEREGRLVLLLPGECKAL